MPLTDPSFNQQCEFNHAFAQFQAILHNKPPSLSARFNYEQADRVAQVINENILFSYHENSDKDQGLDAIDIIKLLHNKILKQDERKNSAERILYSINSSPIYDNLLKTASIDAAEKARDKASASFCTKVFFGTLTLAMSQHTSAPTILLLPYL